MKVRVSNPHKFCLYLGRWILLIIEVKENWFEKVMKKKIKIDRKLNQTKWEIK